MNVAFIWENMHKSESKPYMNPSISVTAGGGMVQ